MIDMAAVIMAAVRGGFKCGSLGSLAQKTPGQKE